MTDRLEVRYTADALYHEYKTARLETTGEDMTNQKRRIEDNLPTEPLQWDEDSANDEILNLHRQLAAEKLRADRAESRADAKSQECIELRERMAARQGGIKSEENGAGVLTDEQIISIGLDMPAKQAPGYLIDFARAIERAAIAAHLVRQPKAEQPDDARAAFSHWVTTEWRPDDGAALLAKEWPRFAFAAFQAGREGASIARREQANLSPLHWLPIEQAPTDGTELLLTHWTPENGYGHVDFGAWGFIENSDYDDSPIYGWLSNYGNIEEPTHFINLAAPVAPASAQNAQPELTVWEGPMPESNGKSNFTAVLHRKDSKGFDLFTDGFQFARSEYPDRVRYEADFMRWLIGERETKPELWDICYDMDKHSGYVKPDTTKTQNAEAIRNAALADAVTECDLVLLGVGDPEESLGVLRCRDAIRALQSGTDTSQKGGAA